MNDQEKARLELLEHFVKGVEQMRKYQVLYFKNRMIGDLKQAKAWEASVDKALWDIRNVTGADAIQWPLL